ncbi:MAG: DUF2497 domain-containing protein [Hyphomicrobiaceae bacterium]|nr:DUF2497 domain-containing protein [Hyphomicrobiaceae bacterium]
MSKSDKTAEPSMDEILASIRKIIAEEPPGTRKAPPVASPERAHDPAAPSPGASLADTLRGARKASIDDVLGLADPEPRPTMPAPSSAQARDGAPGSPMNSNPAGPFGPRQDGTGAEGPRPFFGPAPDAMAPRATSPSPSPAPSPAASAFAQSDRQVGGEPVTASSSAPRPATGAPGDLGGVVPRRAELGSGAPAVQASAAALPQAAADRKPLPGTRPIERPTAAAAKPTQPIAAPAEPTRIAPRETTPALSELMTVRPVPANEAPAGTPVATVTADAPAPKTETRPSQAPDAAPLVTPSPTAAAKPVETAAAVAAPVPKAAAPAAAPNNQAKPAATTAPATKPAAPAAKPAASAAQPSTPIAKPAAAPAEHVNGAEHKTGTQVVPAPTEARAPAPSPAAETPASVAKTAPVPARTAKPAVPADIVPTVVQAAGVRTLEDTVVDLLRPMLRQWLDENMPRMVEKALRIELAASVKTKAEQPKH